MAIASLQTIRTANNAQAVRIQGAEAKLKDMHQAVATANWLRRRVRLLSSGSWGPSSAGNRRPRRPKINPADGRARR
jgi:hypothetical protein